jgi:hypothetical protein
MLYMVDKTREEVVKLGYALFHLITVHSKSVVWKVTLFRGG